MTIQTEKRTSHRHNQEAFITWSYFNTDKYFRAKMFNYSENGIYFESVCALKPRTTILIKIEKSVPKESGIEIHDGFRMISIGEVRWCQEILGENYTNFRVGVKYYEPDY